MRAISIVLLSMMLALPCAVVHAQPSTERIVAPPPPPGMPPRSGTYADPLAAKPQLDLTVQSRRPVKKRKAKKRHR
jgi:hypothetical protein